MPPIITQILPFSPYLKQLIESRRIDPEVLAGIAARPLGDAFFQSFAPWEHLIARKDEEGIKKQLRQLRTWVMATVLLRDLNNLADVNEVMQTLSALADFALNQAQIFAEHQYSALYGQPIGKESREIQHLTVIAMGKLGGRELNASSDIDLIFTYPENGETNGSRPKPQDEFFAKVARKVICLLDEHTEDGYVFRVDMRLRPYGDSGPIVMSETALENYLITQGREWERYAWIKARVVSPYPNHIQSIINPFVYRKYLDFNSFEAMRDLHQQIRQEISRSEVDDNIKLGYGGIREIEFIAQISQMIRGGHLPELQLKGTQETLKKEGELGTHSPETVEKLLESYWFLRNLEHRLQYRQDEQTQTLPQDVKACLSIAHSMGFKNEQDFNQALKKIRNNVNQLFNNIFHPPEVNEESEKQSSFLERFWKNIDDKQKDKSQLAKVGIKDRDQVLKLLYDFKKASSYYKLSPRVQGLLDKLIPAYLITLGEFKEGGETLARLLKITQSIIGRPSYLAFLLEYRRAISRVVSVVKESQWITDYLAHHPALFDELVSAQLLDKNFDWPTLENRLHEQLDRLPEDIEFYMNGVRRFQHAMLLRLAIQELEDLWTVETLSDQLSALADITLNIALKAVWHFYKKAHQKTPQFAIIAYGKLGGKELSYDSDLDLVYLYDDSDPNASEIYSWFGTRLTSFLSTPIATGKLYNVDLRLRPEGESGFIANSFSMFERYQKNHAWLFEHQALTRSRFVAGDHRIKSKFDDLRKEILIQKRDKTKLKEEISAMRYRMLSTHKDQFENVKYARGGLADVEFIVQYLVLSFSANYEDLTENVGNIALLKRAAAHGLIPPDLAEKTINAYRRYRRITHDRVLHDTPPPINQERLTRDYESVKALWHTVGLA